jgi:antitoxin ParD1/3/4
VADALAEVRRIEKSDGHAMFRDMTAVEKIIEKLKTAPPGVAEEVLDILELIEAEVSAGAFISAEEAARQIAVDWKARRFADDDMTWAQPLVEEARAAIARGEVMTLEEHKARKAVQLAALRD